MLTVDARFAQEAEATPVSERVELTSMPVPSDYAGPRMAGTATSIESIEEATCQQMHSMVGMALLAALGYLLSILVQAQTRTATG